MSQTPEPIIRPLGPTDAALFRERRLEALLDRPSAFGSSFEEESGRTELDIRTRFETQWNRPDNVVFGAFHGGELVGTAGLMREPSFKRRHALKIWGVYVRPSARGLGIGRALMTAALDRARGLDGAVRVGLTMESGNLSAQKLYESVGFVRWGTEPQALLVGERYVDEDAMSLEL